MILILFFILVIVFSLSFAAGWRLKTMQEQNDKANPFKELLGPSDDKGEGL